MSKKKSIYIGDALERVLADRTDETSSGFRSTSGVINAVADRYDEIVRRSMPKLTLGEWCLLFDALNGVWMQDTAALYVRGVLLEVHDAIEQNGYDKKWNANGAALQEKLSSMSYCQLVAIVDAAERFWMAGTTGAGDLQQQVERVVGEQSVEAKTMITVRIAHKEPKDAVERVAGALGKLNPTDFSFGWNGAEFRIVRDEHTSIDCDDEIGGTKLLHSVVFPALRGEY